jgi:hypothetical protein
MGVVLLGSLLLGCDQPTSSPPQDAAPPAAAPATKDNAAEPAPEATADPMPADENAAGANAAQPQPEQPAQTEPAAQPEPEQPAASGEKANMEKAQVGVGKKGRGYGGGIITEPLRQNFLLRHRITFQQIDQGMKLYKALHGGPPKTQEEFMKEIVQARNLKLPELPSGDEYWYDAEKGELMVKHPAK